MLYYTLPYSITLDPILLFSRCFSENQREIKFLKGKAMDITVEKVIDRKKVAESINTILDAGIELLLKEELKPSDHGKIKVLRTLGSHINAAVAMVQQETAQQRAQIIVERMKQIGYFKDTKMIE
jgi:hypothetical protein